LKERGYATAHFGKWHLGTMHRTQPDSERGGPQGGRFYSPPWEHGFDFTFSTEAKIPTWDPRWKPRGMPRGGPAWDFLVDKSEAEPYGTAYWSNGRQVTEDLDGDDSKLLMDRALRFMKDAVQQGRPFLAVIWFHAPHLPVVAGPPAKALYPQTSVYERSYYGSVTALDEQMGRLRRELRTMGVADNTMLWFNSDNGPEGKAGEAPGSAGPFRGRKRDLWEGGIRVPGLLEWPAVVRQARVVKTPCSSLDFFPTVLDVLGIPPSKPLPLDGLSLRSILEGSTAERPRPIGFEFDNMAVWMENRYKLVATLRVENSGAAKKGPRRSSSETGVLSQPGDEYIPRVVDTLHLYDIIADPQETRDLAKEQADRVQSMRAALEAWRQSCRDSVAGRDY
jgi:arylsulfatase A-like enzyme